MRIDHLGTFFFALALLHTLIVSVFARWALRFKKGSALQLSFHLLSEVEIVFGLWACVFMTVWSILDGPLKVIQFQKSLNMSEPLFIFCILIMASARAIISTARFIILFASQILTQIFRLPVIISQVFCIFTLGPLLGSIITEPAAITVTALILYRMIDSKKISSNLLYGFLGLLFVNISVGGALTPFAAPPILIVARTWNWGLQDVFIHLGTAGLTAVLINTLLFIIIFRKKISSQLDALEKDCYGIPLWISTVHLLLLAAIVASVHNEKLFFGIFLIFLGLTAMTKKYQDQLKFREGLLVGFFLAGLVVFGSFQRWWLEPLILQLSDKALFFGATLMTAVTDNAALTLLGSQVSSISETSKWALVSGALAGGGLTILANAPNPAGFSILASFFPNRSLNAVKLFLAALVPTGIAVLSFLLLGNF